jgi:hypothetical protein
MQHIENKELLDRLAKKEKKLEEDTEEDGWI